MIFIAACQNVKLKTEGLGNTVREWIKPGTSILWHVRFLTTDHTLTYCT